MLNIVYGIISGILSGMGIGGGAILIMLLTCFENMNQGIAQATNLIFFIPTSMIAIIINTKYKRIKWKEVLVISFIGCIGAAIGASIATNVNVDMLKKLFAVFLFVVALYELYGWYKKFINKK